MPHCIIIKNNLYKNYLTKNSVASNNKNKKYINKLTSTIRAAERNFYHETFSLAKHNISKTWNVIKSIINKDHSKNTINEIKNDNTPITIKMSFKTTLMTIL